MVRPLRIEYPGAVYHVTSRGDRREPIAKDDFDREAFMQILGQALERFDAYALAYCLMGNHYHLVMCTRQANLSRLMRHINGVYTQAFNRRHQLSGHLFQGRFKAILVDTDSYLLEVCRYVDLNPVRAQMAESPDAYAWSSYTALAGLANAPTWLQAAQLHEQIAPGQSPQRQCETYTEFVAQGKGVPLWDQRLKQQIYLGDSAFIERMQKLGGIDAPAINDRSGQRKAQVNKVQASAPPLESSIERFVGTGDESKAQRNQNIVDAFYKGGHTQTAIAAAFKLSSSTVSRVIQGHENQR